MEILIEGQDMMPDLIHTYPYLLAALAGLPAVLASYLLAKRHQKMMMISGLLLTMLAPTSPLHQDVYWSPLRIWGGSFGIEDILTCFSLGSLIYLASVLSFPGRIRHNLSSWVFLKRLFYLGVPSGVLFVALYSVGTGAMTASISSGTAILTIVLIREKSLWKIPLVTSLIYVPYYFFIITVASILSPELIPLWDGPDNWGLRLFGLPIEEVVWIFILTASFSAFIHYAAGGTLSREKTRNEYSNR